VETLTYEDLEDGRCRTYWCHLSYAQEGSEAYIYINGIEVDHHTTFGIVGYELNEHCIFIGNVKGLIG